MKEIVVEEYLRNAVRERGGICVKLDPTGNVGIPDRLVIMPQEPSRFVELKRPKGGRLSARQRHWAEALTAAGQPYSLLKDKGEVDELMAMYDRRARR